MKIALLGKGKTGVKVLELLQENSISYTVFDSKNTPTLEKLKGHGVIISFLPGEVFHHYLPLLLESKCSVVSGSTGHPLPEDLDLKLKELKTKWVWASNFSIGMNLIQSMIKTLSLAPKIFKDFSFSLNEIHHIKKLDAPSGTALSWKSWLGHEMNITSMREGDVTGIHEIKLTTPYEEITLKHEALDRKIFAEGALYAATLLTNDLSIPDGLHLFQDLIKKKLTE